jgi:tetratricopeptide (TPR) repeat protein
VPNFFADSDFEQNMKDSLYPLCMVIVRPFLLGFLLTACIGITSGQEPQPEQLSAAADLLKSGQVSQARDAYEAILKGYPTNKDAQNGEAAASEKLALDARNSGRMDDALRALLRAQTYAPENLRLLYDLGILEDQMRLYHEADQALTTLEELDPNNSMGPQVLYAIARVKIDLGQLDVAEDKLQAYLKTHPQDASAHYGLGRVYQLSVNFDKAKVEFQRSIELQPLQTEAYYQLGDMALGKGAFDEAIADFAKTIARNPKHGGALTGTGEAYFKQKQYKQAEEFLSRAVEATPGYQAGHYYLGLTLARLGRKADSQRELEIAVSLADEESKRERGQIRLNTQPTNP